MRDSKGVLLRELGEAFKFALKATFTIFMAFSWAWSAYEHREHLHYFKLITPAMLIFDLLAICVVVITVVSLFKLNQSIFGFSWWRIVLWLTSLGQPDTSNSDYQTGKSILFIPTKVKIVGTLVFALMIVNLPHWAHIEEEMFRAGTTDWFDALQKSFIFGMIHMVLGIPFAAALGIAMLGLYYSHWYFVGGVELSALYHFSTNLILVSVVLVLALLSQFVPKEHTDRR